MCQFRARRSPDHSRSRSRGRRRARAPPELMLPSCVISPHPLQLCCLPETDCLPSRPATAHRTPCIPTSAPQAGRQRMYCAELFDLQRRPARGGWLPPPASETECLISANVVAKPTHAQ